MSRVLLLLDHAENRQLLAAELEQRHEVLIGAEAADLDERFDLCMVDGPSLDRLWEQVRLRKEREQPALLPVLLVTSRPDVKMITRQVWRSVDELLLTPIEKPELWARLEVLLRARSLSRELQTRAEEAEQAARTRDEVLALVAHDLRNPLNLVLSNSLLLLELEQGLNARSREQIEMIHRASGQMNRLIRDLLEVAGMEGGSVAVEPAPVEVESLIRDASEMLAHAASAAGVSLSHHCAPDLPPVLADRDRVQQIFGNLIGNALKFTPSGGSVHLSAEPDSGKVRFAVADTGPGIGSDDLSHVFDRFWQAQRSRDGGAGLGLAISRGIVVAHDGEMWVESQPGKGSTFLFTLPAVA